MRMSVMFAVVALFTGINLLFTPFQPVPAVWGAILAVAFVLINVVADKMRLWTGVAWIIVAGIIMTMMLKGKDPGDELRVVINVFAFLSSAWYSVALYQKEKHFRSRRSRFRGGRPGGLSCFAQSQLRRLCPAPSGLRVSIP